MGHDHDFYWLFSHFWWLLFPLFWAIGRMIRLYLEHKRAAQALELITTYAQQGKEIPPDLLKVLQQPQRSAPATGSAFRLTTLGFVMAAFALAFSVLLVGMGLMRGDREVTAGLSFVVVLCAGLSAAFLASARLRSKDNRLDPP